MSDDTFVCADCGQEHRVDEEPDHVFDRTYTLFKPKMEVNFEHQSVRVTLLVKGDQSGRQWHNRIDYEFTGRNGRLYCWETGQKIASQLWTAKKQRTIEQRIVRALNWMFTVLNHRPDWYDDDA